MPAFETLSIPADALLPKSREGVARAAALIAQGQLVALPTETVYGLALNLHSDHARRIAMQLKNNAAPWVIHAATADDLLAWVPGISSLGRRLISKSVPGPVAFQIKLDPNSERAARDRLKQAADETIQNSFITLRCPDFAVTQDVLAAAKVPVAIIGAGNAATPAIFEAADLPAQLFASAENQTAPVAAALDGGPTRYRKSSTLVRIEGAQFHVIRAGVMDERILQKLADFTILFLCSGNTCRSPMAMALAAKILADRLKIQPSELPLRHIVVQSAGLHAMRGMRAAAEAQQTVKNYGADLLAHISQPAAQELLRRADVIYTMTDAHREEVLELVPGAERKTHRLDPEGDVADPIGLGMGAYEQVASRLHSVLEKRLAELSI